MPEELTEKILEDFRAEHADDEYKEDLEGGGFLNIIKTDGNKLRCWYGRREISSRVRMLIESKPPTVADWWVGAERQ